MYKAHWETLLQQLQQDIPAGDFEAWFQPIKYLSSDEERVSVAVPTDYNQLWLQENYLDRINRDLNNLAGKLLRIEIQVERGPEDVSKAVASDDETVLQQAAPVTRKKDIFHKNHDLIPNYTFERFIVGDHNALANAAALKVASTPGTTYNPLFLYGGVGLGKTHLMHAIGHKLLKKDINLKVAYLTSEEFMNLFVDSIRNGTQPRFRDKYRNLDILLLDDVQFLIQKAETKMELFNTFNALHAKKKQIVMTSDRTPKQLERDGMDDRLASRIGCGLDVELHSPSIETKQAILKAKADEERIRIPNEILSYIAGVVDSDIRRLEQAFLKVISYHHLMHKEITLTLVREMLKEFSEESAPKSFSFDDIIRETANAYQLSKADIKSKSRTSQINMARQIVMFLARQYTGMSLKEIGMELDKEHPTIINGVRNIERALKENPKVKDKIEEITVSLRRH